ncbi:hypothetical protein [Neomoorella thermoacetica]|uniref:hypothetical protein n=1 Tax=Neomoorella thermoacetica TaxID=1525 RepID=UPI0030CC12D6
MDVSMWASLSAAAEEPPSIPLAPQDLVGKGKIIGFFSVASGAGATTLACLTALAAAEEGMDVALADLAPRGRARTYLGLTSDVCPASVLDVAAISAPEEIGKAGVLHPRKIFVVPGVARALDAPQVTAALAVKVLALLKNSFNTVVAVLGPVHANGWAAALVCDALWAVARPARLDLDFFTDDSDLLGRLGCSGRVRVVLNQSTLPGGLKEEEAARAIGATVVLPYIPSIQAGGNKRYLELPRKFRRTFLNFLNVPERPPDDGAGRREGAAS